MQSEPAEYEKLDVEVWSNNLSDILGKHKVIKPLFARTWLRIAAAAVIIMGVGAYLWNYTHKEKTTDTVTTQPLPAAKEILPGGNKAILTLSGGEKIVLDNVVNGSVATQGAVKVVKKTDGAIAYQRDKSLAQREVLYNTLTTPRGGQYRLTLPDGSKVWLNAESSITYPVMFIGAAREVTMTGEAYFEVVHNAVQPFRVKAGGQVVEVLGTQFNVNAYANEPATVTTLLQGSVRVEGNVLKPGQANSKGKVYTANVQQAVAWKNGLFNFENADLPAVMRQIARWYDVDVEYEGEVRPRKFAGKIQRDLTLSDLLEGLRRTDVHFRIEGRKLIVTR